MDSGGHRQGWRDILGGSATTESPPNHVVQGSAHTGLWAQSGREPFQLSSIWDTSVSCTAEQFLK